MTEEWRKVQDPNYHAPWDQAPEQRSQDNQQGNDDRLQFSIPKQEDLGSRVKKFGQEFQNSIRDGSLLRELGIGVDGATSNPSIHRPLLSPPAGRIRVY